MFNKGISFKYFLLAFILSLVSFVLVKYIELYRSSPVGFKAGSTLVLADYVGFTLFILTSIIFFISSICFFHRSSWYLLVGSMFASLSCYLVTYTLCFWIFYEVAIILLVVSVVVDSPYSERYLASWYFWGYVIFFSIPMVLSVLYLSIISGDSSLSLFNLNSSDRGRFVCVLIISLCFISKVPLLPFHSWLPIVHAESSVLGSVCLSGYVMKLGVLGLYRFCSDFLPNMILPNSYVWILIVSSLGFFVVSQLEMDSKRWLAFLSLSHIVVAALGIYSSSISSFSVPYLYCLGHGLVAASGFILFSLLTDLCGSRNWVAFKSACFNVSVIVFFYVSVFLAIASVPLTITFFCEVIILSDTVSLSGLTLFSFCLYLFSGSLIPMFSVSYVLGNGISRCHSNSSVWYVFGCLSFIVFWVFLMFIFIA